MNTKRCLYCEDPITSVAHLERNKFCSLACARLASRRRAVATCETCERSFEHAVCRTKRRFCSRPCAFRARRGAGHPLWKGGRTELMRRIYSTGLHQTWAKEVLDLAARRCVDCNAGAAHAHHLISLASLFDQLFDPQNGIALCGDCHVLRHGKSPSVTS